MIVGKFLSPHSQTQQQDDLLLAVVPTIRARIEWLHLRVFAMSSVCNVKYLKCRAFEGSLNNCSVFKINFIYLKP